MLRLRSFGWLSAGLLLALVLRALPAEAQFYSLDGRFQCLDNPRAVCFDATSDAPQPAPAAPRPAKPEPPRAAPAKQVAAITKAPRAPVDPLQAVIPRLEARQPAPGDIALLRQRAHAGDKRAIELLAWANLKGIGVAPDPMEAYLLYGFGASLGVPHAKRNQAVVYETMMTPQQRQEVLTIEDETLTPPPR
jgi:TPR repeat protein